MFAGGPNRGRDEGSSNRRLEMASNGTGVGWRLRAAGVGVLVLAAGGMLTAQGVAKDTPRCFGKAATIVAQPGVTTLGTPGNDVIVGTSDGDIIFADQGDDRICSLGGDDRVRGGF